MLAAQDLLQLCLNLLGGSVLRRLLLLGLARRRLEVLPQVVVEAASVARDLDGEELDLDGDASVLLAVVFAAVQSEQTAKAVVLQVLPAFTEIGLFLSDFFQERATYQNSLHSAFALSDFISSSENFETSRLGKDFWKSAKISSSVSLLPESLFNIFGSMAHKRLK